MRRRRFNSESPPRRAILAAVSALDRTRKLRAGMAAADADDATLREFIAVLDAHRKECERECKYVEADIAKRRLAELRALAESREVDTCLLYTSPSPRDS